MIREIIEIGVIGLIILKIIGSFIVDKKEEKIAIILESIMLILIEMIIRGVI